MSYTVTAVGPDWVEVWDGESIVDPDIPRHKSTERVYVGDGHVFQVNDVVALMVRLVARITPPGEEVVPIEPEVHARDDWDKFQALMYEQREDRDVLDQHG
jgi:hypothetical protein